MKGTFLALAAFATLAGPAPASRIINDQTPRIPIYSSEQAALLKMKKAGWKVESKRCARPVLCDVTFINACGVTVRATFVNKEFAP